MALPPIRSAAEMVDLQKRTTIPVCVFHMNGRVTRHDSFYRGLAWADLGDVIWDEENDRMVEIVTYTSKEIEWQVL